MRQNREAKRRRAVRKGCILCNVALMLLMFFIGPAKVLAAGAAVTFGSEEYEKELREEFPVGVYIHGETAVGRYFIEVQYDTARMEYTGGGDGEQDGLIILEGTGKADTIKYMLTFRAVGGGEAGIRINSARIRSRDDGTDFTVTDLGRAPIVISGEDETGIPFLNAAEASDGEAQGEAGGGLGEDAPRQEEGLEEDAPRQDGSLREDNPRQDGGLEEDKPEQEGDSSENKGDSAESRREEEKNFQTARRFIPLLIALGIFLLFDFCLIFYMRIQNRRKVKRRIYEEQAKKWAFEFETISDEASGAKVQRKDDTDPV